MSDASEWVELGQVAKIQNGFAFSSASFSDAGVPIVRMSNLKSGVLSFDNVIFVADREFDSHSSFSLNPGDLLLGMSGSLSNYAIVKREDCPALLNQRVARLSAVGDGADYDYLRYCLTSDNYFFYADYVSEGAAQKNISAKQIESYEVYLPPVKQQQKIAHILTTVDNLIEQTQSLIDKYTAIKQGMMHDLFTRGIDLATGQLRPSYEQAPELYKETELGWVPREWGVYTINQIVEKYLDFRGKTPKKLGMDWGGGEIPALSANNVGIGGIDFNKECYLGSDELYKKWMHKGDCVAGDVIMTMEAPLGNIARIPDDRKYILSQRVILLKANKETSSSWLYYKMMSEEFQSELIQNSSGTTATGIQQARLAKILISRPVLIAEQDAISQRFDSIDKTLLNLFVSLRKLNMQKKGLMQDLLTGRVRVA